jgi:putative Mn2+ efflux pump MntP
LAQRTLVRLEVILLVLPLALDTFAASAALGTRALPRRERLRTSAVLTGFEAAMPVVGLLLGRGVGSLVGGVADYVAAGALLALAVWIWVEEEEPRGGLIAIGFAVSIDELAIGFAAGLLGGALPTNQSQYLPSFLFAAVILVLLIRPAGLFTRSKQQAVERV